MDYTPGTEPLQGQTIRLPKQAWDEIETRAHAAGDRPLVWLRKEILRRVLEAPGNGRRRAA